MSEEETPSQKAQRESQEKRDLLKRIAELEKPNHSAHRTITRGPRKGMRVRKTRAELRHENIERMKADRLDFERRLQEQLSRSKKDAEITSSWDLTPLWVFLLLCGLYGVLIVAADALTKWHLGWLFVLILVGDICGDRLYKRPKPSRKYVPLLWMFR
jgi:hypothetical protein